MSIFPLASVFADGNARLLLEDAGQVGGDTADGGGQVVDGDAVHQVDVDLVRWRPPPAWTKRRSFSRRAIRQQRSPAPSGRGRRRFSAMLSAAVHPPDVLVAEAERLLHGHAALHAEPGEHAAVTTKWVFQVCDGLSDSRLAPPCSQRRPAAIFPGPRRYSRRHGARVKENSSPGSRWQMGLPLPSASTGFQFWSLRSIGRTSRKR